MSKGEKIGIIVLIGAVLIAFAIALTWDVIGPGIIRKLPRNINQVKMEFKKGTLTTEGATIIINDHNAYHFSYSPEEFYLQKRENGKWEKIKWLEFEGRYNPALIRYGEHSSPSEENPIEMKINWKGCYEKLTEGIYRLVIEVKDENDGNKEYEKYLYFQVIESMKVDKETGERTVETFAVEKTKEEAEAISKSKISITNATVENQEMPKNVDGPYDNPGTPRDIAKVKLVFKSGTLTNKGATIYIYDNNDYHFAYHEDFEIEKRENDKWQKVPHDQTKAVNGMIHGFGEIGVRPSARNPMVMEQNWERFYGELPSGTYRLKKKIQDENDGNKEYEIYGYFKVTRVAMIAIPSGEEESPRYPTHEITQREAEETEEERKERENGRVPIQGANIYSGIGIIPGTDTGGESE